MGVHGRDGASHLQNFPGQHPPQETHGVNSLVVARDGNVHISQRRVCVTQINCRGGCEGLVVSPGNSNHPKSQLQESCLDLVSESSRAEESREEMKVDMIYKSPEASRTHSTEHRWVRPKIN